tara:strand:- start:720 stop:893 length:174 start_codon:yes stop_codon:yes gene_type:complete
LVQRDLALGLNVLVALLVANQVPLVLVAMVQIKTMTEACHPEKLEQGLALAEKNILA